MFPVRIEWPPSTEPRAHRRISRGRNARPRGRREEKVRPCRTDPHTGRGSTVTSPSWWAEWADGPSGVVIIGPPLDDVQSLLVVAVADGSTAPAAPGGPVQSVSTEWAPWWKQDAGAADCQEPPDLRHGAGVDPSSGAVCAALCDCGSRCWTNGLGTAVDP
jgi:hypothetical protein